MKRFLALTLFTIALLFGTTSSYSQEKYKVMDEMTKIEAQELQKLLNLDNEQTSLVARTIYARAKSIQDVDNNSELNKKDVAELKAKIDMNFKSRMLSILNEDQFAQYSAYQAEKKSNKE